jgi:hypothetical protein
MERKFIDGSGMASGGIETADELEDPIVAVRPNEHQ